MYDIDTAIAYQNPATWQEMLVMSIFGALIVLFGGMAVARSGRAPFWALFLLIPVVQMAAFWIFAYTRWPAIDGLEK